MHFSPDGNAIASSNQDGTIILWNLKGRILQQFRGHRTSVGALCFSRNGQYLISGSRDQTVRIWNWRGILPLTFEHKSGTFSADFSLDGQMIVTAGGTPERLYQQKQPI